MTAPNKSRTILLLIIVGMDAGEDTIGGMMPTESEINEPTFPPRKATPPPIDNELGLIGQFGDWLRETQGASLDIPAELLPLLQSWRPLNFHAGLRASDPQTVRLAIARFIVLGVLTDALTAIATAGGSLSASDLVAFNRDVPGTIPDAVAHAGVMFTDAAAWLAACTAPAPDAVCDVTMDGETFGIGHGTSWGSIFRLIGGS